MRTAEEILQEDYALQQQIEELLRRKKALSEELALVLASAPPVGEDVLTVPFGTAEEVS